MIRKAQALVNEVIKFDTHHVNNSLADKLKTWLQYVFPKQLTVQSASYSGRVLHHDGDTK